MKSYKFTTAMGQAKREDLPFFTDEQFADFNSIGYSGCTIKGEVKTWYGFLTEIFGEDNFSLVSLKSGNFDFIDEYNLTIEETVSTKKTKERIYGLSPSLIKNAMDKAYSIGDSRYGKFKKYFIESIKHDVIYLIEKDVFGNEIIVEAVTHSISLFKEGKMAVELATVHKDYVMLTFSIIDNILYCSSENEHLPSSLRDAKKLQKYIKTFINDENNSSPYIDYS
jgi:hypothetical protein